MYHGSGAPGHAFQHNFCEVWGLSIVFDLLAQGAMPDVKVLHM